MSGWRPQPSVMEFSVEDDAGLGGVGCGEGGVVGLVALELGPVDVLGLEGVDVLRGVREVGLALGEVVLGLLEVVGAGWRWGWTGLGVEGCGSCGETEDHGEFLG